MEEHGARERGPAKAMAADDGGEARAGEAGVKQETGKKSRESETKTVRLKIGTSQHDLEMKAKQSSEFLKEGHRVKIDLFLRGPARFLCRNFLKERIERVLPLITENYKIVESQKMGPRGISIIIEKAK